MVLARYILSVLRIMYMSKENGAFYTSLRLKKKDKEYWNRVKIAAINRGCDVSDLVLEGLSKLGIE